MPSEFGLFRVFLGIEAGTADSLRRIGHGQTPAQNERALEIVNRLDLHACFNLLLLNPDSTLEDFRANVAFLRGHCGNPMNFCRTEIYAGTPLELKLRREGRLLGDYWGYGYRICEATFSKEEVSQARNTPTAAKAILKRELGKRVVSALLEDLTRAFDVNLELAVSKDGTIGKVSVSRLVSGQKPTVVTKSAI